MRRFVIGLGLLVGCTASSEPDSDANVADMGVSDDVSSVDAPTFVAATITPRQHTVSEDGMTSTATLTLDPAPTREVVYSFRSLSDQVTVTPAELVFPPGASTGTLTIAAVDDAISEGEESTVVTNSVMSWPDYIVENVANLSVTVLDDEPPQIAVSPDVVVVTEGRRGTFSVRLLQPPPEPVTVTLQVSDEARLELDRDTATFNDVTYAQSRVIGVTAFDDEFVDRVTEYEVFLTATGAGLDGVEIPPVPVQVIDDGDCVPAPQAGLPFIDVAAGGDHTCGVREGGVVECWGSNSDGQAVTRCGPFETVTAGPNYVCALDASGRVTCWGADIVHQPPDVRFLRISGGNEHLCGVDIEGDVYCWGSNADGQLNVPSRFGDPSGADVLAAGDHTCVRTFDGVACQGANEFGANMPPNGIFVRQLFGGRQMTCGFNDIERIECWGANDVGQSNPPFADFTVGPDERFEVDGGITNNACLIYGDEEIVCWGANDFMQSDPPPGNYRTVSVGRNHACAIDDTDDIICWGDSAFGKTDVPE